jgi:predicted RNase H-like HicB family nuclease
MIAKHDPTGDMTPEETLMRVYSALIERCPETEAYVGFVPGFPGAHSQVETLDDLTDNLREVVSMLLEDGDPVLGSELVGVQNVPVA